MPRGQQTGGAPADGEPPPSLWERLSRTFLKPVDQDAPHAEVAPPPTLEELEDAQRYANDKERLVGLIAAPIAAAIGFLIISSDTSHDPPVGSKLHVAPTTYHWLLLELLVLAVGMLAAAWFRKRMLLGAAMALYGLSAFNLHWWGFGVPYILFGSWLLVRHYRAQKAVKEATEGTGGKGGAGPRAGPQQTKRYTPPTPKPKRPLSGPEEKAG